jgi:hypothetical protein
LDWTSESGEAPECEDACHDGKESYTSEADAMQTGEVEMVVAAVHSLEHSLMDNEVNGVAMVLAATVDTVLQHQKTAVGRNAGENQAGFAGPMESLILLGKEMYVANGGVVSGTDCGSVKPVVRANLYL